MMIPFKHLAVSALFIATTMMPLCADTPKTAKPLPSKHAAISDTVTQLEHAKKTLQADTSKDVNNHRANAITLIEKAMVELRAITQGDKH